MSHCNLCGMEIEGGTEFTDRNGRNHLLCSRCAPSVRENPELLFKAAGDIPICDACGRRHSSDCSLVDYAGTMFNVCGGCVPEVMENPADFLAGKRGTSPER